MKNMNKILIVLVCAMGSVALACAQGASQSTPATAAPPVQVKPADAKDHAGDIVTVCGKVVDTKITKYGLAGRGKPVVFDIDQPEPNPVFYFVAFGSKEGGPDEAIAAYKGKSVCITGKVTMASGTPYIMAVDRSSIKTKE
jgi:hypothetical protein